MHYYEILKIAPTIDLNIITAAFEQTVIDHPSEELHAAYTYLQQEPQRYFYYAKITCLNVNFSRLPTLVAENNLTDIIVIVKIISAQAKQQWKIADTLIYKHTMRDAILLQRTDIIRFFLAEGFDINSKVAESEPQQSSRIKVCYPLSYFAGYAGNLETIQLLIQHGGIFANGYYYDHAAMQAAVMQGHVHIVDYLLSQGALANGICCGKEANKSFLQVAAENDQHALLELLSRYNASVETAARGIHTVFLTAFKTNSQQSYRSGYIANKANLTAENTSDLLSHLQQKNQALLMTYQHNLQTLFDYASGTDFSPTQTTTYHADYNDLDFLYGYDVTHFNFVGVSLREQVVTADLLAKIGALNAQKACYTVQDYQKIEDIDRRQRLITQIEKKAHALGALIVPDRLLNLLPLWRAAQQGDIETVTARLNAGISPNENNRHMTTPLCVAAKAGHEAVVQLLLATPGLNKDHIFEAIRLAHHANFTQITQLLYAQQEITHVDEWGNTLLHIAVDLVDVQAVQAVLQRQVDVNALNEDNVTALQMVTSSSHMTPEHLTILQYLLDANADPNLYADNEAPLINIFERGFVEMARLLLPLVAKQDIPYPVNTYPKRLYIPRLNEQQSQEPISKILNKPWYVPLMFIAIKQQNRIELLTLLHQYGANFNILNERGESLLNYSIAYFLSQEYMDLRLQQNRPELVTRALELIRLLVTFGADIHQIDDCDHEAITYFTVLKPKRFPESYHLPLMACLQELKTHLQGGYTPLHQAAMLGNIDTIQQLLADIDVNVTTVNGYTPLHFAALYGQAQTCLFLLTAGAQANIKDLSGLTAFEHSMIGQKIFRPQMQGSATVEERQTDHSFLLRYIQTRQTITQYVLRGERTLEIPTYNVNELIRQRNQLYANGSTATAHSSPDNSHASTPIRFRCNIC